MAAAAVAVTIDISFLFAPTKDGLAPSFLFSRIETEHVFVHVIFRCRRRSSATATMMMPPMTIS